MGGQAGGRAGMEGGLSAEKGQDGASPPLLVQPLACLRTSPSPKIILGSFKMFLCCVEFGKAFDLEPGQDPRPDPEPGPVTDPGPGPC